MKLTETDRKIINALIQNKGGIGIRTICTLLNIQYASRRVMTRRIKKMRLNGIVTEIRSYPRLYKLGEDKEKRKDLCASECPKCQTNNLVYKDQDKKVCKQCHYRYENTEQRKKDTVICTPNWDNL